VVSSNANGTNVSYAWDANNRLQTVTDNRTSGTTNYTYDATNQLQSFTYPNGVTHAYTYDNRDRNISLTAGGVVYTQPYSFSGRKQSVSESTGRNTGYSYDNIYRLLNENITGAPSNGSLNYTLDAVGNRLALTSTLAALQSQTASYDPNDRISGDTFDANGNTLTSGGVTYTYDFEDRLLSASAGVQMVYDGDGNRISRTEAGLTTRYLIDDLTPTGYTQVTEEIVSSAVTAQYTYGLMRIGQRRATLSYYGYDGGGSVRQLFNGGGTSTDSYAYDAFGNTVVQTGSTLSTFLYRGEQFDAALGMYYLRARYYRPLSGRFLTKDHAEGNEYKPRTSHLFLYGGGDPVGFSDPSGYGFLERAPLLAVVATLGDQAVRHVAELEEASIAVGEYAVPRAQYLYQLLDRGAQIHRSLSTAWLVRASDGARQAVVAVSSGRYGPIAEDVEAFEAELAAETTAVREVLIRGIEAGQHAEDAIVQYAAQNGYRIYSIAVIGPRPVCGSCENVLDALKQVYIYGGPY